MSARRFLAAVAAAVTFLAMGAQGAFADDIYNNLDNTVDSAAEIMALNFGGSNGVTTLAVQATSGGTDTKNGCNLGGSSALTVSVNSSNTTVATVTPTSVTFTSCGTTQVLTVVPKQAGTATISLTQTANNSGGTFDLAPATFTVNVAPPANSAPTIAVTGVTMGGSYPFGAVPTAACSVSDAEDGHPTVSPVLSAITGPDAASGIGSQTATCSYTDAGGLTASSSATYSIVKAASTTTVTCSPASLTYTGSALTPCTATVTGSGGLSTTIPVTYGANTNVGTATATAAYAGSTTHNASNGSATFTITKATSTTVVTCPTSAPWTGAAVTPCTAKATGAGGLDVTLTPTYTSNTAVGTATASASFAGDANHTSSNDSKTFQIVRAQSVVTFTCASGQVYTGTALTPCTAKVTSTGGFEQPLTVTYSNNVGAGSATASASFAGDSTHAPASDSTNFAIAKATSTTTVTCNPTTVTYTGSAQTPCAAQATGAGIATPIALTPTYAGNTNAGTADVTAAWAGDANHTSSNAASTFTISKATSTVTITCPTSSVYTGSSITPCSASATGAGITTPVSLIPAYTANTNVGTAHVDAAWAGDANHTAASDSTTFAITKAPSTVTISCSGAPYTYTGAALTPCTAQATGAGITTPIALTPAYAANTNAGTADVTASWAGDANHSPSTAASTFTIDKATSTVTVTCPGVSQTYTGSAQQPCTAAATGAGGLDVVVTNVTYTDNTNAGTATAWATFDGDANHTADSGSANFAIGRYTPVVTVSCPDDATYNGAAHPCTATVQGVGNDLAGATTTFDYGVGGNVNAGDVSVIATFTAGAGSNYSDATGRAQFTIAQYTPTVSVSCPATATYNGLAHPCTASVQGIGHELDSATATIAYGTHGNVNAGAVTATASFTGGGNYTNGTGAATFTIARFTPTVTVSCPTTATYNATAHPCTAGVEGVGDELDAATVAIDYGTHGNLAAGDVTAVGTFEGGGNYNGATGSDAFTIGKATSAVTVTCDPTSVTYTGSEITPCSARATGVGSLDVVTGVTYTDNTDAGQATAWATYDGDGNHAGSSSSATFTITKAASTVTVSCPTSAVYTGESIAPCTATATGVGGLDAAVTPVNHTNNVNVGTASASAAYDGDANHNGSTGGATFAITKAASTVTVSCPTSKVYTGQPIAPCTATATGVGGLDVALATVNHTDNTDVGTASASATYGGDANHNGSTGGATFSITKATSTVTVACPTSQVYTGSALTPCSALLTGAGLQATSLTVGYAGNVIAGTATASAAWAGDANHTGSSDSNTFEITKATSTVSVTCPTSMVYTGSALAPCTAMATGAGGLDVPVTPVSRSNNVNVGAATASATYGGDANHEGSTGTGGFAITKATSSVSVTCPTSRVYTGAPIEPCSAIATGAGGLNVSLTELAYASNTNTGNATAAATYDGDANHTGSTGHSGFEITKASSEVTVTCTTPKVYTGAPIEPCSATATGVGGLDVAVTPVTYGANTNAGPATATATYSGDANHNGSTGSGGFQIAKATSTVSVTCPPSLVFTGSALTPCSALLTGAGLDATDLTVGYANNTHAGTATASASWTGDDNHTAAGDTAHFTIDKATSAVTVTCDPTSITYTGSAITPCSAAASGAGDLNVPVTPVTYAGNIDAGTASASATYTGGDDHLGSTGSSSFLITKADSTITFTCPASRVYTGSAIEPCTARVTGAGGLDQALDVTYAANTSAGTATASASYAGDDNHNGTSKNATFDITPAASQVTVTCPTSKVYTGGTIEPCTAAVTGPGSLNASVDVTYANNTSVGTATASATFAGDANHTSSTDSKTFEITKATSTVTVTCPTSQVYSGSALTPCSALLTGAGLQATSLTVSYVGNVNAGTATASAAWAGDDNHTSSEDSKTFAITKAGSVTAISCPEAVTYTGTAQAPCTATVTGAGGLNQAATVSYTDNTDAGTAHASAGYAGDANHTGSVDSKTFQITKAGSVTTITCPEAVTYTGTAQAPCTATVTGAGGLNQAATVSYTDNTDAGTAHASAGYTGDANHTGSSDTETFTIEQASSTTAITCPEAVTYTGTAQAPCTATVTGAGGLNQAATVSYTDNTDAGTAHASAGYTGDANHTGSSDSRTFTIEQASSTTTASCPTSKVFTGAALEPCTATVTGAGGLNQAATVYTTNTNAGTAHASAGYAGDANHTGSSDSKTFTIDQATSATAITCPATVTYNSDPQEPCTATVTGAGGLNQAATVSYTTNTDAGTAHASAGYAGDDNHTSSFDTKTFTIDKAASTVVVSCPGTAQPWTGAAQEPCTAKATRVAASDVTLTPTYSDNTEAGTATASAGYAGDANHNGSTGSATFDIVKAPSNVAVTCPASEEYTGSDIKPCTAKVTGAGGLNETLTVSYENNRNAGEARAYATFSGDSHHLASGGADTFTIFTITQASSTVTITCPATATYTAATIEPCTAKANGAALDLELAVTYTTNTNTGTATASASYDGDANHTGSSNSKTFTITPAGSTTTITCPAAVTYTGSAQTPCAANATGVGGLNQAVTVTYTNNTAAGTATAWATYDGDANHSGSTSSKTFTIEKADSATTITCPEAVTYTGSAQTPCTATVTGVGGLNAPVAVTHGNNSNAGTATAAATYVGDANHNGSSDTDTFTINKADSTTSITCPDAVTFTGTAQEPCTATVSGAGGLNATVAVTHGNNTNAGTATASATYAGDANHNGSSDADTFTITKAGSTTSITCPDAVTFTGSAHTPCTATVTGAGGLNTTVAVTHGNNTNAGTATASATYAGDANHNGSSDADTFTINQAGSTVTITCPAAVTYTGSAQTPCTAKATGVGGLDQALTVTYTNNTDAGTATAWATYDGDANHTGSNNSKSFTIGKATSATMITCPEAVTYTGSAQTPCTATVTGAGGLNATVAVTHGNNTNAGTATAAASYTGDANHNGSSDTETFAIDKAGSTTTVSCPTSQVYTGSTLEPCTAAATGVGGLNASVAVTYGNNTNVGTANASATYAGDANHTGSTDSKTFEITKATSTVTVSCPTSQVYSGSALMPCSALLTGAGLQATTLTVGYAGNVNVGTATASAAWSGDANHTGSSDSKTFEITKAASTVTVTCTAGPFVYTGTAFTPCSANATGVGGLNVPVSPVSYGSNTNAGLATASATYGGDANHTGSTGGSTFTIAKAPSTVTVTCTAGPFVYTGTAFTPCSAKASGVAMSDVSLTPSYADNTYPGTATASASWAGDGNHLASTSSATFTIGTWGLRGFYQPVDMSTSSLVLNSVKGGSTVPLKFEIFSEQTELTTVSAVKSFTAKNVSCSSSAVLDDIELTTTGGTSLRYDSTGGQFIQNWQTPKTVGSCIQVTMTAQDNSSLTAFFKIK